MRSLMMILGLLVSSSNLVAEEKWDIELLIAKATPAIREVLKQDANIIQGANMQIDFIREERVAANDPNLKIRSKIPEFTNIQKQIKQKVGTRPYWRIGIGVRELIPQGGYIFYFSTEGEYLGVIKYV